MPGKYWCASNISKKKTVSKYNNNVILNSFQNL